MASGPQAGYNWTRLDMNPDFAFSLFEHAISTLDFRNSERFRCAVEGGQARSEGMRAMHSLSCELQVANMCNCPKRNSSVAAESKGPC